MTRSFLLATSLAAAGCSPATHERPGGHADHAHGHSAARPGATATLMVRTDPARPRAGEPVTLHLMIHTADGRMVQDFDTVHEAKVHLVVVREGLDQFAHLHPRADAGGNLTVAHAFPVGGTYRLFADFAETGKGPAVAGATVQVGGDSPPAPPVAANAPGRVAAGDVEVEVTVGAGRPAELGFAVTAGGRPVNDLRPHLGAAGHLFLVSADGARYVHVHPAGGDPTRGRLSFEAHFPAPGLYKGWLEFRRGDRVNTVPFILRAAEQPVDNIPPAGILEIPRWGMCGGRDMDAEARKKVLSRVNRIAGQVAGVQRMVAEDRYCVEILHQIAAVRSALDSLGVELLTRHLESCVVGHGTGSEHQCARPMTKDQLLTEVQTALSQFLK